MTVVPADGVPRPRSGWLSSSAIASPMIIPSGTDAPVKYIVLKIERRNCSSSIMSL